MNAENYEPDEICQCCGVPWDTHIGPVTYLDADGRPHVDGLS